MRGLSWVGLCVLLLSCGDGGLELFVDLKTDLVADVEFRDVQVLLLDTGTFQEAPAIAGFPFDEGQRVAEFEGLGRNPTRGVRVVLLDGERRTVAEREVVVQHTASRSITVLVTRDCRDVTCPEGDTCYGGRCVDPGCVDGTEPECPMPECEVALDCEGMNACSMARCEDTVCVYVPNGSCAVDEYCDPEVGCRAIPMSTDAGMDMDAGTDAGPDLGAPSPHWPPNGHPTGSVHAGGDVRRPTFRWQPVAGAVDYELQVTSECSAAGFAGCAFAAPTLTERVAGTSFAPAGALPVAMSAPVGTRYFWRVRACNGMCGDWSAVRYVDVGRLAFDVNGDGYDDMVAGGRYAIVFFRGTASGIATPGTFMDNPVGDATSSYGTAIAYGDVNADGFRDVLVGAESDRGFGSIMLHFGSAAGLGPAQVFQNPPGSEINDFFGRDVAIGDFDADGYGDLAGSGLADTWWYRGGTTVAGTPMAVGRARLANAAADVDGDGFADLLGSVVAYGGPAGLAVRAGTSAARFSYGDLDGDGWLEVGVDIGDTGSRWATTVGGVVGSSNALGAGMGVADHQVGPIVDVDGDGTGDVFAAWPGSSAGDQGTVWFVPFVGSSPQSPRVVSPCSGVCRNGWGLIAGADFNGDGLGDAAVGYPSGDGVGVLLGRRGADPGSTTIPSPGGMDAFGHGM